MFPSIRKIKFLQNSELELVLTCEVDIWWLFGRSKASIPYSLRLFILTREFE